MFHLSTINRPAWGLLLILWTSTCLTSTCLTAAEYDAWFDMEGRNDNLDLVGEDAVASASCCDGGGCDLCDCECDGVCDRLFGIVAPSDMCFCDFISPMTNPVFFEDPRTLSELRFIYIHHKLPPALGADNVQLFAMQFRAALTDRLSLIATKDGYITTNSPLLNDGWADVAIGLKYNLYKDPDTQTILSGGVTYELPIGSTRTFQGNGDGEFNLFLSGGKQLGCYSHWISTGGIRLPTNTTEENQVAYWSNHFDRRLANYPIYGFVEFNYFHWMKSGTAFPLAVEGGDLFNLGAVNVAGNSIVTGAFGSKVKPTDYSELGVAWEVPLTERRGVLDNRLTLDYIIRY